MTNTTERQLSFFKGGLIIWFIVLSLYVFLSYMNYIPTNIVCLSDTIAYISIVLYFIIGIINPKFFNSISFSTNKSQNDNTVIRNASILLVIYFLTRIIKNIG